MSKQIQDAYIVAATRTPIGKSGRGYFRNTRPDDLLVAAPSSSADPTQPTLDELEQAALTSGSGSSSRRGEASGGSSSAVA